MKLDVVPSCCSFEIPKALNQRERENWMTALLTAKSSSMLNEKRLETVNPDQSSQQWNEYKADIMKLEHGVKHQSDEYNDSNIPKLISNRILDF